MPRIEYHVAIRPLPRSPNPKLGVAAAGGKARPARGSVTQFVAWHWHQQQRSRTTKAHTSPWHKTGTCSHPLLHLDVGHSSPLPDGHVRHSPRRTLFRPSRVFPACSRCVPRFPIFTHNKHISSLPFCHSFDLRCPGVHRKKLVSK